MPAASPAWKPQATFALLTMASMAGVAAHGPGNQALAEVAFEVDMHGDSVAEAVRCDARKTARESGQSLAQKEERQRRPSRTTSLEAQAVAPKIQVTWQQLASFPRCTQARRMLAGVYIAVRRMPFGHCTDNYAQPALSSAAR